VTQEPTDTPAPEPTEDQPPAVVIDLPDTGDGPNPRSVGRDVVFLLSIVGFLFVVSALALAAGALSRGRRG